MATRPQKRKAARPAAAPRAAAAHRTAASSTSRRASAVRGIVGRGSPRHGASKRKVSRTATRPARRIATFLAQHASDAPFLPRGLRTFWEYRDLGIAQATGGRYGGFIVRSNHAGTESTGIHFHKPDVQLIYILKGWLKADYRGQGTVTLEAGTMLHNPPGNPHNVFAYSEDLEFLEITAPAEYPTVDVESVEGPLRVRRAHA
jgi:mannose-6-phosphate isomerase-like protein (cupin superfamily)